MRPVCACNEAYAALAAQEVLSQLHCHDESQQMPCRSTATDPPVMLLCRSEVLRASDCAVHPPSLQLGRLVMFLFKLPDETAANRRLAKNLIEAWSRPILAAGR